MNKILLIGIGCVAAKYLGNAIRRSGYQPVFLVDINGYAGESRTALEKSECHQVNVSTSADLLRVLEEQPAILDGVVAIATLFDEKLPVVDMVARHFGIRAPEPEVIRLSEKAEVLKLIPEYCPASAVFPCNDPRAYDGNKWSTEELILKPSLSSGAVGVKRLSRYDNLRAAVSQAIACSQLLDEQQYWILQENIIGRLISFEGYVQNNSVYPLGFSRRTRIGGTEVANEFPIDSELPAAVIQRCYQCLNDLVQRSGLHNGYFHCEFVVNKTTAYLIDANIGRVGGASIVEQIALAHAVLVEDILQHVVLLSLGLAAAVPRYLPMGAKQETLSIWYGLAESATLKSICVPNDLSSLHTQFARPGNTIPAIGESDYSWVGMLTGNPSEAIKDIERIIINTSRGACKPVYALHE